MLVRMSPRGVLFDTNIKVSVEDYNITEDGKRAWMWPWMSTSSNGGTTAQRL